MGRRPCCVKEGLNRGAWTTMEDKLLRDYINVHGEGKWRDLPTNAGLKRCGKSCRLRWLNYLKPNIKRGNITPQEEDLIINLRQLYGNRWSLIAGKLPGRTDNEIKNYWNTILAKRVLKNKPNSTSSDLKRSRRRKTAAIKLATSAANSTISESSVKVSMCTEASSTTMTDEGIAKDTTMAPKDLELASEESNILDDLMMMEFEVDEFITEFLNMEFVLPYCHGGLENTSLLQEQIS